MRLLPIPIRAHYMEVGLHANVCDQTTSHVAKALHVPFEELSARLRGNYGGVIEHLWIDLELLEYRAKADGQSRFPFRFQKRVSGHSRLGLPAIPDSYNVGHYSVRPDFQLITSLPTEKLVQYVLSLIYDSTSVLIEKQRKLGGFNAALFRNNFVQECRALGYEVSNHAL